MQMCAFYSILIANKTFASIPHCLSLYDSNTLLCDAIGCPTYRAPSWQQPHLPPQRRPYDQLQTWSCRVRRISRCPWGHNLHVIDRRISWACKQHRSIHTL